MATLFKLLLVILVACFLVPGVQAVRDDELAAGMLWFAIILIPPGLAVCRLISYRKAVGTYAIFLGLVWSTSPLMQHAVDRHAGFWMVWAIGEAVAVVAIYLLFRGPKRQRPNGTPEPKSGTHL